MNIIRNGVEIELTPEELREAYYEQQRVFIAGDIESRYSICNKDKVVKMALSYLYKNDAYFEAYWASIEEAVRCFKVESEVYDNENKGI